MERSNTPERGAGTAAAAARSVEASDSPVTVSLQLIDDAVNTLATALGTKALLIALKGDNGNALSPVVDSANESVRASLWYTGTGVSVAGNAKGLITRGGGEYETVAASQTDQALGATGGTGDLLAKLIIVPATTSPGAVSIKDGAGSAITVFTGGASSVADLKPFEIVLDVISTGGAWSVTTGANVSVIGVGDFT